MSYCYQGLIIRASEHAAREAFQELTPRLPLRMCQLAPDAFGVYAFGPSGPSVNPTGELLPLGESLSRSLGAAVFYKWHSCTGHHVYLFVEGKTYCHLRPLIDYAHLYPKVDRQWVEYHRDLCINDLLEADDLWIDDSGALLPDGPRILQNASAQSADGLARPLAVAAGIWPAGEEPLLERGGMPADALNALGLVAETFEGRIDYAFNCNGSGWIAERIPPGYSATAIR